jgi:hypothetical protein
LVEKLCFYDARKKSGRISATIVVKLLILTTRVTNRKQSRRVRFVTIVVLRVKVENKNDGLGRSGLRLLL